ncbi:SDR family NAD(P)-dependent oxidoreductase, partial [Rhizobium johnstonii]|uniref:SDR family NAD(P)-dependent oxidoreductase n=1 Tax=Rhizobium johnstonii TaxID=3019933 RepID=UPI003F9811CC
MPNQNSTSKVAIVTVGSRGLGRNTVVNLARSCFDVIFTYNSNRDEAENVVAEIESLCRKHRADTFDKSIECRHV